MDEPSHHRTDHSQALEAGATAVSVVAAWRAVKSDPNYREIAARQAASAASADVEDRVMEWVEGIAAEAWDDL